jgi:hypothetical protein
MNNLQNNQKNNETPMGYDTLLAAVWIDNKGRQVEIHTMSDRWLNNIRKKFKKTEKVKPILAEIKRRKLKRNVS